MFINITYFYLCLYFSLSFLQVTNSLTEPFMYKCLNDDLKIKKICAIEGSAKEEDEDTLMQTTINYLYIKDTCDSDERCKRMDDLILYQCFPKLKKLKIGDKCSVNEECYTGFCSMGICQGVDFEADCSDYPNACKPGTYCAENTILNTKICVEYAKTNEICGYSPTLGYNIECLPGLLCQIRDNGSGTTVCKKWGTFDVNKEVTDERLCKSGMALIDSEVDNKLKCIAVDEEGECDEDTHKCNPQIIGIGDNPDAAKELIVNCVGGLNNMYGCPISNAKAEIYKKYIEEYNKRYDGEKLQKSQFFIDGYFNDKTLTELYIKYKQFDYLIAYEYIDFEGNVNGLYSCEYGFMWGFLSSNIIKLSIIKLALIILFIQ